MAVLRRLMLPFARRFVAGETVDSALEHSREINEDGVLAYIDLLGEHVEERQVAEDAVEEYLELLHRMGDEGIEGGLSIKLTHLGLEIDRGFCRENVGEILEAASEEGRYVWIDMESSDHTDETIELYLDLYDDYEDVGICIQSALKRSEEDVERILEEGGEIRLVKGAYDEPREVAYQDKEDVDDNFRSLMSLLFDSESQFAIATHDEELVEEAKELAGDKEGFEFQFLMGVKDGLERELAEEGYTSGEYVPYGPEWLSYYWRRVRERRENLFFALRSILRI